MRGDHLSRMPHDIFVSYSSNDRERVRALVEVLDAEGWSVWWDRAIKPGGSFEETIDQVISEFRCVMVCWTESETGRCRGARTRARSATGSTPIWAPCSS